MEDSEQQALNIAPRELSCWCRYVDDTFVIWPHGMEELQKFNQHLNIHKKTKFMTEIQANILLLFLDVR
jgi:hypothetical protein